MQKYILFAYLGCFSPLLWAAEDVVNTRVENTLNATTAIHTSLVRYSALAWDLTEKEWAQYQDVMQGVSGKYYSTLTPPEVLGIEATNAEDLAHFADIVAKQEHDKIARELRFNAAFVLAAKRLYASEPMIQPFDLSAYTPLKK